MNSKLNNLGIGKFGILLFGVVILGLVGFSEDIFALIEYTSYGCSNYPPDNENNCYIKDTFTVEQGSGYYPPFRLLIYSTGVINLNEDSDWITDWEVTNYGTININGGTLEVYYDITNYGTINNSGNIKNPYQIINEGIINNYGTIENPGNIIIGSPSKGFGTISNNGDIINSGRISQHTIENNVSSTTQGSITNNDGGTISTVTDPLSFSNHGIITNNDGASISSLVNYGTISNGGTIHELISNLGSTVSGSGNIGDGYVSLFGDIVVDTDISLLGFPSNPPLTIFTVPTGKQLNVVAPATLTVPSGWSLNNDGGTIIINSDASLVNFGSVSNIDHYYSGKIRGIIDNFGTIINSGSFFNEYQSSIRNYGIIENSNAVTPIENFIDYSAMTEKDMEPKTEIILVKSPIVITPPNPELLNNSICSLPESVNYLYGCNLPGADLSGMSISSVRNSVFTSADFSNSYMINSINTDSTLTDVNFSGANLGNSYFNNVDLRNANLNGAVLDLLLTDNVDFSGAKLNDANISGLQINLANFTNADFSGISKPMNAYFASSDFTNANFAGTILDYLRIDNSYFSGAKFNDVRLVGASIKNSDFTGADLSGADMTGASILNSDFTNTVLVNTIFPDNVVSVNLSGADVTGFSANFDSLGFYADPPCIGNELCNTLPINPDVDEDGVVNASDNCPNIPNYDQSDVDDDGVGDLCDKGNSPIANDDVIETTMNIPIRINYLDNDWDPDDEYIDLYSFDTTGTRGTVVDDDGALRFTPETDFVGTTTFQYTIFDDPAGNTGTATVTINVLPAPILDSDDDGIFDDVDQCITEKETINLFEDSDGCPDELPVIDSIGNPPIANDDSVTTTTNTPTKIKYLDNDSDPDGDEFFMGYLDTTGTRGTVVDNDAIDFIFTPETDFVGTTTFEYTLIDDPAGNTGTATVTINVLPAPETTSVSIPGPIPTSKTQHEQIFCKKMTIPELVKSGLYNVIDNSNSEKSKTLDGTKGPDLFIASIHGDTFNGLQGGDCIIGGPGDDVLHGNGGNDVIFGQGGNDSLHGRNGNDWVFGESGNDVLMGYLGNDYLRGGDGDDILLGGPGNDNMLGQKGDDQLDGQDDDDLMKGNMGHDECVIDPNDTVPPANCEPIKLLNMDKTLMSHENTFTFGGMLESAQKPQIDIMKSDGRISTTENSIYSQGSKSIGTPTSQINSGKVCGLSLCSEELSIEKRIELYKKAIGLK